MAKLNESRRISDDDIRIDRGLLRRHVGIETVGAVSPRGSFGSCNAD